jgi:hypothetical protein
MQQTTKTPSRKPSAPKAPALMLTKSDSVQVAIDAKPFNHLQAIQAGKVSGSVEENLLMLLLAGKELPTWKDFTEAVKENNKSLPTAERIAIPNSKTKGFNTINQAIANVHTIRDIATEFPSFNPLMAWNAKASTAKRVTEPTISAILKLARAVKNGAKPEATPFEIFEKGLKLAYKGAIEFKNDKKAQQRVAKLLAMAQADGITLETETETETDE